LSSCDDCGRDNLQQYHKYCRRCGAKNPSYVKPVGKIAEPTSLEIKIARRLFAEGIDFTLSPEIWYSSCTFYTPDFLIEDRLVIEIDGQHHYTDRHQVLMDRIRQRAIQNSGYPVHRFTNKEVSKSLDNTVNKIVSLLRTSRARANQTKIIEVDVSNEHRLSNVHDDILIKYVHEIHKRTIVDDWSTSVFKDVLSKLTPNPACNRCAMQTIMLMSLGLNFRASKDGTADFQNYAVLFEKATTILREFFGEIATVELRNEFNITATNFLKNLVYKGKPSILTDRVINIKNYDDFQDLVKNFNTNFSTFGIAVVEDDLKMECIYAKKGKSEQFDWIGKWENKEE
jgi:hypothetical protein